MKASEFIYQTQGLLNELRKVIDESTPDTWQDDLKQIDEKYGLQGQLADLKLG